MTDFSAFHSKLLQERPSNWSGMCWGWGLLLWPGGCADKIAVRDRRSSSADDQNITVILRWLCTSGLLDDAALTVGDEVGEVGYVFACAAGGDGLGDGCEGFGGVELRGEEGAVGGAGFFELLRGEACSFERDFFEAVGGVVAI